MKKRLIALASALLLLSGCTKKEPKPIESASAPESTAQTEPVSSGTSAEETADTADTADTSESSASSEPEAPHEPEYVSANIVCAGDNLIHSPIYRQAATRAGGNGYDFSAAYEHVAPYIEEADLAILNQETIITDEFEPSSYPCFATPTEMAAEMVKIGFDAVSVSNNHVLDKGEKGLISTLTYWAENYPQIPVYGAYLNDEDMNNIRTLEVNGIKFAFLGYTEHTNGLSLPAGSDCRIVYLSDIDLIEQQIKAAKEIADCVIVSAHFGIEVSNIVTDQQRELSQKFADWGADIIVGTQPHTIQTMQYIDRADGGRSFVFYCLGNFISAQSDPRTMVEYLGRITVTKNCDTGEIELSEPNAFPLINHYDYNYANIRVYPFSEYTPELAAAHGCSGTSYEYFENLITEIIPEEFLAK